MTLGSLFDGIGGFPLVASWHGIKTLWASEIDAACVSITRRHFPHIIHLGDITKINGALIHPVDIITFGSPCQDLSVAGKRAGLKHEGKGDEETTRSGLFMEAIRIIREMRAATNGIYPRIIIWENVPGAFSSNGGEDFRVVLEEICRIADAGITIPRYTDGWPNAGLIVGDGYSVGWRQLDAQHWRVPQRRKRIYLVADFGGRSAAEILFKPEGLRRHSSAGKAPWERFAGAVAGGAGNAVVYSGESVTSVENAQNPQPGDPAPTLNTDSRKYVTGTLSGTGHDYDRKNQEADYLVVAGFAGKAGAKAGSIGYKKEEGATLRAEQVCHVAIFDGRGNGDGKTSPTMTGDHNGRISDFTAICLQGNGIDRADTAGCNGKGWAEDVSYTLNTIDRHAVAVHSIGNGQVAELGLSEVARTLNCMHDAQAIVTDIAGLDCRNATENGDLCGTLQAKGGGGFSYNTTHPVRIANAVRRLTPTECARLQGYPDDWAAYGHDGKRISDAAQYRAYGNSLALPCADYIISGAADVLTATQPQEG